MSPNRRPAISRTRASRSSWSIPMRDLLLSLASPASLSRAGFLILAFGLLGEVGVLVIPKEKQSWHNLLGFVFAAVVLVGYLISHIGDDASLANAELELKKIKTPRTISPEQHAKMVNCLRPGPKGPIFIRPAVLGTDAPALAKQLEK